MPEVIMETQTTATQTAATVQYGDGTHYEYGVEYAVDADRIHHVVRRPLRWECFLGYGYPAGAEATGGNRRPIVRIGHDGPMTEWRYRGASRSRPLSGPYEVIERPTNAPMIPTLPDEEHGAVWGDPIDIDIASREPVRYRLGPVEVTETEAREAMARYSAAHPGTLSASWPESVTYRARRW